VLQLAVRMSESGEKDGVNNIQNDQMTDASTHNDDDDDKLLLKMGYPPLLHRGLSSVMNFAFGFTEVCVLGSVCLTFNYALATGGPACIFWTFLVQFLLTIFISFSMAEICSAYPSAGSVYHWSGQLTPLKWAPLCSYICGWANFVGNAAGDATFATGFASFLSSALVSSGYSAIEARPQVGISIAVIFFWSVLNCFRIDQVGWVNNLAAVVHTGSLIIILVALLSLTPKLSTADFVFTGYNNTTGWTDHSYVGAIGITAALFSFAGYEASAHMSEETTNSRTSAPKGIINTVLATGIGGLVLILGLLFANSDIAAATTDDPYYAALNTDYPATGNAAINVFILACGNTWGQALAWLVLINIFFAGISSVAVTGRITFALTRDKAFPYSDFLSRVNPLIKTPVNSIMFVFVVDALLQLLPLDTSNGTIAYNSIIGLATVGWQISYAIPILLKLIFNPKDFPLTPLSLGRFSAPCGWISTLWLLGSSCLFFLPTESPVNEHSMNWLVVVVSGTAFLCGLNWIFNSQYNFSGPRRSDLPFIAVKTAEEGTGVQEVVPLAE